MVADKPTELSRIKLKNWTRQPVPMISEHSAYLTSLSVDFRTWLWRYTYLMLLILMLWRRQGIFKSKRDKLCSSAECRIWTRGPIHQIASRIERRQVVFLCRMLALNPGSQTPNRQQTECSLTNRLSYRGSSLKLELDSPSLWSASIQPTWPQCQLTFAPGSGDIHICSC